MNETFKTPASQLARQAKRYVDRSSSIAIMYSIIQIALLLEEVAKRLKQKTDGSVRVCQWRERWKERKL